jgi:hypothetical protein
MNRTCKILPLVSLLLLPVLASAQADTTSNEEQRNNKASTATTTSGFGVRNAANTKANKAQATSAAGTQRNNDKRSEGFTQLSDEARYTAASTQDTVLVSEICTYSQYTYTYTCK